MNNRLLKSVLLGTCTIVAASASYAIISQKAFEEKRQHEQDRLISSKLTEYTQLQLTEENISEDLEHTVKSGESISSIFSDLNLSREDLHKIIHTNETGKQFADVLPGKNLVATIDAQGKLEQLAYAKNPFETLIATRNDHGFDVGVFSKKVDNEITTAHGIIHSSLFEDGLNAGLSEKLILGLAEVFAWDIDFALNLRDGDQFTVIYEKLFVDGQEFDSGDILAVEFINHGKKYSAVRYIDNQGNSGYYTPEGNSLKKAFLQTPMDFAKISSHFSLHRKHPVLNTIRAHKGVDYSAAIGTPVKSTGDGKVAFKGEKNGYGNVIEISHANKYSTLYAHLSGFKSQLKVGSMIKQGDIIGYVGNTGLATGPHLHYEFRINGEHINPVTAKIPHSIPLDKSLLVKFKDQTKPLMEKLAMAKSPNQVALN